MPLVNMQDMLAHAYGHGYAVGAYGIVSLDFLEAIVQGAETCHAPVILSLAEVHFEHFDFELAMAATVAAARRAHVPVAIHLDHGMSLDSAVRAIRYGCNGVMIDASTYDFEENVARTQAVARMAHACGVPTEGKLGYAVGVEGEDAEKHQGAVIYTSVEHAQDYVQRTGVDFLAVSIGTVHGRMRAAPKLDLERLARINDSLDIPLAIHDGTKLSSEQYQSLIARGVAKINCYTALADAAATRVQKNSTCDPAGGYTGLMHGIRLAIQAEVERSIRLFGGAGRAAAVLAHARPWREVEHLIVYNANGGAPTDIQQVTAHGRELLAAIPGVRRVYTGEALKPDAKYRYCWLVRFAHAAVIDSYRNHPQHVAFADHEFRPIANDRVSIDYELIDGQAGST